ncbi:uncharacterized protein METZ01_LOCUS307960, partial [marine metagenome]
CAPQPNTLTERSALLVRALNDNAQLTKPTETTLQNLFMVSSSNFKEKIRHIPR